VAALFEPAPERAAAVFRRRTKEPATGGSDRLLAGIDKTALFPDHGRLRRVRRTSAVVRLLAASQRLVGVAEAALLELATVTAAVGRR
jgi:hypothetical protein